jgi:hypothetical protein
MLQEAWEVIWQAFHSLFNPASAQETFHERLRLFAAKVLSLIDADQPYGAKLFNELNRLDPHLAVEGVCVRRNQKTQKLEVWLRLRGPNEAYPNQYEVGGSAIQNGEDYAVVVRRVAEAKFKAPVAKFSVLYGKEFFQQEERGWYCHMPVAVFFETDPVDQPGEGTGWFPVKELPPNVCPHHLEKLIPAGVEYFLKRENLRL